MIVTANRVLQMMATVSKLTLTSSYLVVELMDLEAPLKRKTKQRMKFLSEVEKKKNVNVNTEIERRRKNAF